MRKITIEDLANKIKKSISEGKVTTYYIEDVPFRIHEGKKREFLDVQVEDEYDTIFEKLCESLWSNKNVVFWNNDGIGTYKGMMIVDSTVIVEFNYCSLEGQNWLYQKYKSS